MSPLKLGKMSTFYTDARSPGPKKSNARVSASPTMVLKNRRKKNNKVGDFMPHDTDMADGELDSWFE